MDEYRTAIRRIIQLTLFVLSASVLAWGFTDYKAAWAGFALGTAVSLFNAIHTARKIDRLAEAVLSGKKKGHSLGMLARFAASALAAVIALRYPEHFHILFTVIGLMASQILALVYSFFQLMKTSPDRAGKG